MSESIKITLPQSEPVHAVQTEETIRASIDVPVEITNEEEAKNFIKGFVNYFQNGSMQAKAEEISKRTGMPAKEVSRNFVMKTLGIIGTALEIGLNTAGDVVATIINFLGMLLLGAVDLLVRTAQRLIRMLTLNQGVMA